MKSLGEAALCAGGEEYSCTGGIVRFPDVASDIEPSVPIVERDFLGSTSVSETSLLLLRPID
jgi:hypothetical protein